jgi:uncharacterized membrane protein
MAQTREEMSPARIARFLIRPNSSLSWRGNRLFFASLCLLSFGIAGAYAAIGLWLVLPFAGLEMLVLGAVLYQCAARAERWEMISIDKDTVEISAGRREVERRYNFDRHWARVILDPAAIRGYPARLLIRSHGREVEIGACLLDKERYTLAQALRRAI